MKKKRWMKTELLDDFGVRVTYGYGTSGKQARFVITWGAGDPRCRLMYSDSCTKVVREGSPDEDLRTSNGASFMTYIWVKLREFYNEQEAICE